MKTSRRDRRRLALRAGWSCLAAAVCLAGLYACGLWLESKGASQAYGNLNGRFEERTDVVYQGVRYRRRADVEAFLFMGIDRRDGAVRGSKDYRGGGQCDFLMLAALNRSNRTMTRIQIDRDTMAEITVLGVLGDELGVNTHQICLAHGFGDGAEQSCRFTAEAVSRLMMGIPLDGYVSMDLDGIAVLNDLLGGVTVTIEDDFSALDPAMTPGTRITLNGAQAETFVRSRVSIGDGSNASRMLRQERYLNAALELMAQKLRKNARFAAVLLDELKPYMLSDLSRGRMINEANRAAGYDAAGTLKLPGRHAVGEDGFVEFHVDADALKRMALDVFYEPIP